MKDQLDTIDILDGLVTEVLGLMLNTRRLTGVCGTRELDSVVLSLMRQRTAARLGYYGTKHRGVKVDDNLRS